MVEGDAQLRFHHALLQFDFGDSELIVGDGWLFCSADPLLLFEVVVESFCVFLEEAVQVSEFCRFHLDGAEDNARKSLGQSKSLHANELGPLVNLTLLEVAFSK